MSRGLSGKETVVKESQGQKYNPTAFLPPLKERNSPKDNMESATGTYFLSQTLGTSI